MYQSLTSNASVCSRALSYSFLKTGSLRISYACWRRWKRGVARGSSKRLSGWVSRALRLKACLTSSSVACIKMSSTWNATYGGESRTRNGKTLGLSGRFLLTNAIHGDVPKCSRREVHNNFSPFPKYSSLFPKLRISAASGDTLHRFSSAPSLPFLFDFATFDTHYAYYWRF